MARTTPSSTIATSASRFATNDERTAKRISDALGTATELRAMRNYAGHRLAPWLGHVMVSRQETARPLLTPGRGHAAAARRRAGAGLRPAADPGEEAALLRGSASYRRASCRRRRPRPERRWTATPRSQFRRPKMIGRAPSSRRLRPTPKTPRMPASAASRNCRSTRTSHRAEKARPGVRPPG